MRHYTLTELCTIIREVLSIEMPDTYWVKAEIASMSTKGGHGYFELVEKAPNSSLPAAKIRATCWANIYPLLTNYFAQETGSQLQVGMQVLLEVEVSFHPAYGMSLNIRNIDPRFTVGDLARQRAETLHRLQQEGILDMQQQLHLPTLPLRLAVISAESAAGYSDFCDQLRQGGYRFCPTLFGAIMQGEKAERSILSALSTIANQAEEFDAVVIIRGGGASTDLSCFDSYLIAAACAQFELPVLTGIGHTRDVSVLDIVAHQSLKTPTAVAAFLIDRLDSESERLLRLRQRLGQTAERQIMIRRHRLEILQQRILACNPERIYAKGYSLATVGGRVIRNIEDVQRGETITTHLANGSVASVVQ